MIKSGKIRFAIGAMITIIIMGTLMWKINISLLWESITKISILQIAIVLIMIAVANLFRSLRFKDLLNNRIGTGYLFSLSCAHQMINNALPARIGELSYPYFLKRDKKISFAYSAASLVIARIFDVSVILIVFLLSTMMVKDIPESMGIIIKLIAFISGLGLLLILVAIIIKERTARVIKLLLEKAMLKNLGITEKILRTLTEMKKGLSGMRSKRAIIRTLSFSIAIWTLQYLIMGVLVRSMGYDTSIWKVFLGASFVVATTVLPVQGILGLGSIEGAWIAAMVPLGMPLQAAANSIITIHVIIFAVHVILGLYGLIGIKIRKLK